MTTRTTIHHFRYDTACGFIVFVAYIHRIFLIRAMDSRGGYKFGRTCDLAHGSDDWIAIAKSFVKRNLTQVDHAVLRYRAAYWIGR